MLGVLLGARSRQWRGRLSGHSSHLIRGTEERRAALAVSRVDQRAQLPPQPFTAAAGNAAARITLLSIIYSMP